MSHAANQALSFLSAALLPLPGRYTYGETLGRWRTADLLIGLAYLCRRDPDTHPIAGVL